MRKVKKINHGDTEKKLPNIQTESTKDYLKKAESKSSHAFASFSAGSGHTEENRGHRERSRKRSIATDAKEFKECKIFATSLKTLF